MFYDTNLTPFSDSPLTELKLQQKQATSPIIFSSKKSGYILEILGDAGVAAGELEKLKRVYGEFVKQNQYVEIRVRIPDVHSYLDPLNVAQHNCICIALKGDYLKVGAPVQASFENPVDTSRGYIVNSQNVTGDGSKSRDGDDSDTSDGSNRFLDPTDTGTKKDNKPVYVDKGFLGLPFKCEVRARPGARLKGVRQRLIREAEKIAEAAGWYYGATKKAALIVTSGKRDPKPDKPHGNHSTGNAFDFDIEIDRKRLGRMESYAFVAAMIEFNMLSNKRMGLYLDPKWYNETNGVVGFYGGSHPHYDLRTKGGTERWVRFYPDPDGDPTIKTAGDYKRDEYLAFDKVSPLKIPKSVRLRFRQLYYGYRPYSSTEGAGSAPKVEALDREIKKQKDSWEAWKKTEAGKSFGATNSSLPENQNRNVDLETTQASLSWKLSKGGPLQNFEDSPNKEAMGKLPTSQLFSATAKLHFDSKIYEKQDIKKDLKFGGVGIDTKNNELIFNRPYPTRVTKIPIYVIPQKKYFEYWSQKQRLVTPRGIDLSAYKRSQARARKAPSNTSWDGYP